MAKPRKSKAAISANPIADDRRYRAENALSTLTRAEDLKKDKALMRDVARLAKEQATALGRFAAADKKGK